MAADAVLVGHGTAPSGTSCTTTGGTTTTGSTFVVSVSYDPGTTISSVTDSKSNTYTLINNNTGGLGKIAAYRCENGTGGASHTATVNFSGTAFATVNLIEGTGVPTSSVYDSASLASGTDGTTPYTITSATFAQADEVVLAMLEQNSGPAGAYASSNFTILSSESDTVNLWTHGIAKLVIAATTAQTPSFTRTNSTNATCGLIVFGLKASGGAAADATMGRCIYVMP